MPLTGQQSALLRDALLNGFTAGDLEQLMMFRLSERMANIIPEGPLATVAFNLINWADAHGRVGELIEAVAAERPRNAAIQQAVATLRTQLGLPAPAGGNPPIPVPTPTTTTTTTLTPDNIGPTLARVRKLLLDLFPNLDELVILFEDTLGQRFASAASSGTHDKQVHAVVQWANANRPFRLCPLLAAVASQHPNSTELTDLRKLLCQS